VGIKGVHCLVRGLKNKPSVAGSSLSEMAGSMTGDSSTTSGECSVGMPRPAPAGGNDHVSNGGLLPTFIKFKQDKA